MFPEHIKTFVDLFAGSFSVGINANADNLVYNDICSPVVNLMENFNKYHSWDVHQEILNATQQWNLDRANKALRDEALKENYLKLRKYYNQHPNWVLFYTLLSCSFSNQIRFNSKNEFNMPYGARYYNPALQVKLQKFVRELHKKRIEFWNKDFRECEFQNDDFVYCDPPYYNSTAPYNENGGWSEQDEKDLLNCLDNIDKHGRFALSNNLKYNNPILDKWKNKYNVHYLRGDYSNCNYHKKNRSGDMEVLITNY